MKPPGSRVYQRIMTSRNAATLVAFRHDEQERTARLLLLDGCGRLREE
jgi:hypothetical protein